MTVIIQSVLGVFCVIGAGMLCRRLGWVTRQSDRSLASLVTQVMLPMYFLDKMIGFDPSDSGGARDQLSDWMLPVLVGFLTTSFGFALSLYFAKKFGRRFGINGFKRERAFALSAGICNYGYIPYPLAQRIYPSATVDLILHNVGVELALWSVGIWIISAEALGTLDASKPVARDGNAKKLCWRILSSGPLVAVVVGVALRWSGAFFWIPPWLMSAIQMLSQCAIPLGLLLGGAIMADYAGLLFRGRDDPQATDVLHRLAAAVLIRQWVMPTLMLGTGLLLAWGHASSQMLDVIKLQAAMPAAIFPIVLSRQYDKDVMTAVIVVVGTSMVGLILIPVWISVGIWLLG